MDRKLFETDRQLAPCGNGLEITITGGDIWILYSHPYGWHVPLRGFLLPVGMYTNKALLFLSYQPQRHSGSSSTR